MVDIVRIGRVHDIDVKKHKVRVYFEDEKIMSGWLKVLTHTPVIPEERTGIESGGAEELAFAEHSHNVEINAWFPTVNDNVLCLYIPVFNGDGFVLGVV